MSNFDRWWKQIESSLKGDSHERLSEFKQLASQAFDAGCSIGYTTGYEDAQEDFEGGPYD